MSYQVLARKWRPKNFAELVGQTHVMRALTNALEQQRLHHAYLFTGTRGVGKTTIARILAKSLNCEQGITPKPCGQCDTCLEIDQGRFVDLLEIDAASRTKVEDTREILDNVQYAPTRGRYKIYLIDEVHMLSGHSFNALLKTLEEPPPHVVFLLATTDPQKLPVTVLSRCLQFYLKNLPVDLIQSHLAHILKQENIAFEPTALQLLAQAAKGSMRDALSLTDQAIAYCEQHINENDTRQMLGGISRDSIFPILDALLEQDASALLSHSKTLAIDGLDFTSILEELITTLQYIAIAQAVPKAIDDQLSEAARIHAYAQKMPAEEVQLFYQIALIGKRDLPLSPEPRTGFDMVLLRLLSFKPDGQSTPVKTSITQNTHVPSKPAEKLTLLAATQPKAAKNPAAKKLSESQDWNEIVTNLNLSGMAQALAHHCRLKSIEQKKVLLEIGHDHAAMLNHNQIQRLQQALNEYFGQTDLQVRIDVANSITNTPAQKKEEQQSLDHQAAVEAMKQDPVAQQLMQAFNADLDPKAISAKSLNDKKMVSKKLAAD